MSFLYEKHFFSYTGKSESNSETTQSNSNNSMIWLVPYTLDSCLEECNSYTFFLWFLEIDTNLI